MRTNLDKINPLKRDKVAQGIDLIEEVNAARKTVDRMLVFGSAVRDDCTEESDIDVCLFTDCSNTDELYRKIYGGLKNAMDDLVDIINFQHAGENLRKEIMEKGVSVYEYRMN